MSGQLDCVYPSGDPGRLPEPHIAVGLSSSSDFRHCVASTPPTREKNFLCFLLRVGSNCWPGDSQHLTQPRGP